MVLLTLGTGVGGAILCDGRLLRGSRGQAGEIGHSIVVPDGRSFGRAGVDGIMEGYASASAVAIQARDPPADSSLSKLKASKGKVDCEDVFKHADAGDHFARKVVQETAKCPFDLRKEKDALLRRFVEVLGCRVHQLLPLCGPRAHPLLRWNGRGISSHLSVNSFFEGRGVLAPRGAQVRTDSEFCQFCARSLAVMCCLETFHLSFFRP